MEERLAKHDVVLLGVGHTNAHVVRMWRMKPPQDMRLTCVSNFPVATYSGMLPGTLAGLYPRERMEIDLVRLCASAGARLIVGQVTGIDHDRQELLFADRAPIPFDVLSIGIGSVPKRAKLERVDQTLLPIKPMQTFLDRLEGRLQQLQQSVTNRPLQLAVVGAGAGGVEITFCLPERIRKLLGEVPFELSLVDRHDSLSRGLPEGAAAEVEDKLRSRGVRLLLGREVREVAGGRLVFADGEEQPAEIVLWAASAAAAPLLSKLDLPTDQAGFLLTKADLQTVAGRPIFAVGDTGTIDSQPVPKAGVYAVRQGPVLWQNIQRLLRRQPLKEYEPQRGFLKLLNTGDGRAVMSYGGMTFSGRWCWWLKDRIDGRFMDKYQDYEPMEMAAASPGDEVPEMRCAGCGGKVGGGVLSRVLQRLDIPPHPSVAIGLDRPDDAAVVRPTDGRPITVTADFFAAPLDDAYASGRIAALNAASDVFATGGKPVAALALATIPPGPERKQEQLLYELLSGSLRELQAMGATLVGGHTIEGPQTTIGFTILADQHQAPLTKDKLQPGDALILAKPLGTGVLLKAHMQAELKAAWYEPLLECMLQSNQQAADIAAQFDVPAVTDVTGFGLAGHLLEMLRASGNHAQLDLAAIPLLPGFTELAAGGIQSTLAPANRTAEAAIDSRPEHHRLPQYAALFDPQTGGGLLLGCPAEQVDALLARLQEAGYRQAAVIGWAEEGEREARLRLETELVGGVLA